MFRRIHLIPAAVGALAAAAIAVGASVGSSHREAPLTALDPTADNTDVYAFKAPDAPDSLTMVANWIPFEDPAGGPNFYRFDDRAHYWINIDNTGTGKPAVRYLFTFKTAVKNPNSFLYAAPTVTDINSANLNVTQTYTVTRYAYDSTGKQTSATVLGSGLPTAPNNVGPKTMPSYANLAAQAIQPLSNGGRAFAGQRDDPFFVDLGDTFDGVAIRLGTGNQGGGKDDLAGYAVHSIVLQVPQSDVTRDGQPVSGPGAANAVIGVWSTTDRRTEQVSGGRIAVAQPAARKHRKHKKHKTKKTKALYGYGNGWVQVSRLGNPLVNELVIPIGQKDHFNATTPDQDAKLYASYVLNPELAHLINVLYPGLNVPEHNRTDIVQALLTGIPGKTEISPYAVPADTLKINLGVPITPNPNRFGVIGGDLQGFPDGRRLTDDVVDISERVVGGYLVGNKLPLGDGVDQNDKPFLSSFPYLAAPDGGPSSSLKRIEPTHSATPADNPS